MGLKGRDLLEDVGVDGRTILKFILKKKNQDWRMWTGLIWLRIGINGRLL
jgi:hypothetical protein